MRRLSHFSNRSILSCFIFCTTCVFSPGQGEEKSPLLDSLQGASSKKEAKITDFEARLELSRVLSYLNRFDESLSQYQRLLQEQPHSFVVRREMAAVLFFSGKIDEAAQEMLQIPEQELDEKSRLVLADILVRQERYLEAEAIYRSYLAQHPTDDAIRFKLAALLSWEKQYAASLIEYRLLLDRSPTDIQIRRHYAQVLTWMGEEEAAIEEWKKTLP